MNLFKILMERLCVQLNVFTHLLLSKQDFTPGGYYQIFLQKWN